MRITKLALLIAIAACETSSPAETSDTGGVSDGADATEAADGADATDTGSACAVTGTTCTQGDLLKDVELQDCDGNKVVLSDKFCGTKATVISFGAGWCEPCRKEQPLLQEWYSENKAKGLDVIMILKEQNGPNDPATRDFCAQWRKDYSLTFPVLIDPTNKLTTDCLGTGGVLPVVLVTGPEGKVYCKNVGGKAEDCEDTFKELLDQ